MKAIIIIGHRRYLVNDAKKAIAFASFMETAQEIDFTSLFKHNEIILTGQTCEVSCETVSATATIKTKPEAAKGSKRKVKP